MGVVEKEEMAELVVAAGGYLAVVAAAAGGAAQKAPEINEHWHVWDGYRSYVLSATGLEPSCYSRLHHNSRPATAAAA